MRSGLWARRSPASDGPRASRRLIVRGLFGLLALIAAAALLDLLPAALHGQWSEPHSWSWVDSPTPRLDADMALDFRIAAGKLSATYSLTVPRDSRVVSALWSDESMSANLGDYLGALRVDNSSVAFSKPRYQRE